MILTLKSSKRAVRIKVEYQMGSHREKYGRLLEDVTVELSDGTTVLIPKGLKWDFSSSPKWLWGVLPPFGDFLIAALIHDYLYIEDYRREELRQYKARQFADKEMLKWSTAFNSDKWHRRLGNNIRYYGVRLFGWVVY